MPDSDVIARRRKVVAYFLEEGLTGPEGFKEAMKVFEFATPYICNHGDRLYAGAQIQRLIAEEKGRHTYTKEKAAKLLRQLQEESESAGDRTNKLGVIKELDRIHGLYTDEEAGVVINQIIVSPQERKQVLMKELALLEDIESAPLAIAE